MTNEEAIEILKNKLNYIPNLRRLDSSSQEFKQWHRDTIVALKKIFADREAHAKEFSRITYYCAVVYAGMPDSNYRDTYLNGLNSAEAKLKSMTKEIEDWGIEQNNQPSLNSISIIENLCKKFHRVARQLLRRRVNRSTIEIKDEYDVQDLLHGLLTLHFDDIRQEEWTPSYAGSSNRMDFLLKKEQIVIETKKTRNGLGAKDIGDQLIIDIQKYQAHPDCKTLICFVYDPEGKIHNPKGIENDLNRTEGDLIVKVIIAPTGL